MKGCCFIALFVAGGMCWGQDRFHPDPSPYQAVEELDLSEIFVQMEDREFKKREEATMRLLEISRTKLPEVSRALFREARENQGPEVRFRIRGTFERIFRFRMLGVGDSNLGVDWHWHIQLAHEGEMRARPLVRALDENSPAAESGLKVGDIVCYVDGKELHRQNGLPELRRILREATPGQQLTFTVRNVELQPYHRTTKPSPNRKVTLTVHDTVKGLREAKPGEFQDWYENLRALYDEA
ncbi:MAG: PDZ domain-containing protein [Verrucomicrobiota bacterium JB023]|nr:PDZ domain-containing protein [Verrucomicrobiota bacterium JB023]